MLGRLIAKELLEHLMSLRFAIACLLCLVVVLTSLFVRSQEYEQRLKDYDEAHTAERSRVEALRRAWPFPHEGLTVYRRPSPLRIFARGAARANVRGMRVNAHGRPEPILVRVQNTSSPLFPEIDLIAFVGVILSLMAIVFGYDAICGEKERGTLRLMLSYPLPRHTVLLAKWVGAYVALVVPFLLTVLVGAMLVLLQPDVGLTAADGAKLGGVLGVALLYVAVFTSLSLYISALTRRAAASVLVLLCVWVVFVLGVPNLSPHLAEAIRPAASAQEAQGERLQMRRALSQEYERKMRQYERAHGLQDPWWRGINWNDPADARRAYGRFLYGWQVEGEHAERYLEACERIEQTYGAPLRRQVALSRTIGRISPFTCFAMAAGELAEGGAMKERRYREQLGAYQRKLSAYAFEQCEAMTRLEMAMVDSPNPRLPPWHEAWDEPPPEFHYVPAAGAEYARAVAVDAGLLAGVAAVFYLLSFAAFVRYDVR